MGAELELNIMMIGGRRCGKTSVLAAMQGCFENLLSETPLVIAPANFTVVSVIESKRREMKQYFQDRGNKRDFFPDNTPTKGIKEYPFFINLKNKAKDSQIKINFIDYPGEWLVDPEHIEDLIKYMSKSRILLVAIDTPHLMEQRGYYNDQKNLCYRVSEMVKTAEFAEDRKGAGMVLFVPLKCERYYNRKEMGSVCAEIQKAYRPLLQYLEKPGINEGESPITTAITPILTMGGAEFSRFQRNTDGDIDIDEKWGTPKQALYHFPDMNKDEPEPLYCEQPLLYILSHTLKRAKTIKESQKSKSWWDSIVDWFQTGLLNWPSSKDYLKQAENINKQIKSEGDGYIILNRGSLL